MAGELYHPVALFPTADKFGGQAGHQTQDAAGRERPEHLRSAAGLAVGDLSQPERLLQEESPPGLGGEEMALHPSP